MHQHAHHHSHTGQILNWSLLATASFVVIEIWAGTRGHSLSLLSDAGHNATDALALLLAWFGMRQEARPPDERRTFGYQRAGVLTALVNALTLILISAWIFYEGVMRIAHPEPVNDRIMAFTAMGGILMNGAIVWGLARTNRDDLNLRSALVHMMGDLIGSAAIVIGAVVLRYTGWLWLDPVLSMVIAALIVWSAWDIVRESLNILLEALPRGMSLGRVKDSLRLLEGVLDVHDLHIWSLGSRSRALSCHVLINDVRPSESFVILESIRHVLADEFKIRHTTVQFEHLNCCPPEEVCAGHSGGAHDHEHDHAHDHHHAGH
jgi:cobalt-zinc-cadmium efflux system protein